MVLHPGIATTTGPHLFGVLFNYLLLGALLVQVYNYALEYPNDKKHIKAIVYFILILEVVQSALMANDTFIVFGEGFGDLDTLDINHTDWLSVCIIGSLVAGIVQLFYARRLFIFSGSRIAAGFVCLLAIMQVVAGIIQGIESKIVGNFSDLSTKSPIAFGIWVASTCLCDIIIAASMVYYLRQNRTSGKRTNAILSKLISYSVETGFITAVLACVWLILFLAVGDKGPYFEVPAKAVAKLYSNNLMVVLNSRSRIKWSSQISDASTYPSAPAFASNPPLNYQLDSIKRGNDESGSDANETQSKLGIRPTDSVHMEREVVLTQKV